MNQIYTNLEHRITPNDTHYFFGYFDKCPWYSKGEHPIHRVPFAGRQPRFGEAAEIDVLHNGKFDKVAASTIKVFWMSTVVQNLRGKKFQK